METTTPTEVKTHEKPAPSAARPSGPKKPADARPRVPQVGDDVFFWPPHPNRDVGHADQPLYAKIAKLLTDETGNVVGATLAVLAAIGTWQQRPAVKFSDVPKTNHWTLAR